MNQYAKMEDQYSSFAALKEQNCIGVTCLSSENLEKEVIGIKGQKAQSVYRQIKAEDITETLEEEDQIYQQWKKIFDENLRDERKDPLEHSIFKVYRWEVWFAIFLTQFGVFCHSITPLLLYFIYDNITQDRVHSLDNKILVLAVVICRIFRTFCCYYGEIKQNKAGLKMYRLMVNAIVKKTIACSPLTNKNISATQLSKTMQTDCSLLLLYPVKLSFFIENIISFVMLSAIILYVAGLEGFIGICLVGTNLIFRFLFKKIINRIDKQLGILTKERVTATIETFNIIKFIKANALESCYYNKLRNLRIKEVSELKTKLFLEMIQNVLIMISKPLFVVIIVKLLVMRNELFNLQVLFTVNLCMIIINMQAILNALAYLDLIDVGVLNIEEFMKQEEMDFSHIKYSNKSSTEFAIQIKNGNFQWTSTDNANQPPDAQTLNLRNINIKIKKGELVTLIGAYGSGKTSLTNCLLGEMNKTGNPQIVVNGSIAYASQVPWIMNDTIRNNILFGKPYDFKRYSDVIKFSSLQPDLLLFPNGDLEIIGARGSTLSGGQRARVALARALYSDADIYILDDILSAVDAHVGAFLFSMTIKKYLKSKTILLITHSLYYVSYSDRIMLFEDGQIKLEGSFEEVSKSPLLMKIETSQLRSTKDYQMVLSKTLQFAEPSQAAMRKMEEGDAQVGIGESFKVYIKRNSGCVFSVIMILFILVLSAITTNTQINLNKWALSPEARDNIYLYIQLILNGLKIVITLCLAWVLLVSRMFQSIHDDMVKSLLFSPLSYFQKVPSEKIINRLSNDLNINDKIITSEFGFLLVNLQLFLSHLFGIIYIYIIFGNYYYIAFLVIVIAGTLYLFESIFSLSMKINKLEQENIIPINSKYTELLDGLPVIRAYRKIHYILQNFWNKMNLFSMAAILRHIIDARLRLLVYSVTNLLAIIDILSMLYLDQSFKNYTIFVIFNYFALEDTVMRFYQSLSAFAPRLQSLGKCEQLTNLEPQRGYENFVLNNWKEDQDFEKIYFSAEIFPKGEINFKGYCLRYSPDSEDVLKHLSFTIYPGEKIGIVGRTGSGKSSMMLGLLRIIEASSGRIQIDGKDISKLSLEELRSNVNIILQDHFMFAGTVRENVDPTGSHSDQQIEETLKLCGVWEGFAANEGVNTVISEGGGNLSSGQKQLLNICRSLLNPKRIVLIDEATASIDIETDALIQKVIKKQFADKTVLTIAHRINTVVESDRILVLNKGEIAQFDSPEQLLQRDNSIFAKLYHESGKSKAVE